MGRLLPSALLVVLAGCAHFADAPGASGILEFSLPTARGALPVHVFVPEQGARKAPVWVVMHGQRRDARAYFQTWLAHARAHEAILVVPEFEKAKWPKSTHYQLGNVRTRQGNAVPRDEWAFTVVDRAVDEALRRAGRSRESARISFYGHGAGAQFVQRYVLHTGGAGVRIAIAANAGWYLLPEATFDFPYGLRDAPIPDSRLREALAAPLLILLGQADLRADGVIRRNAQADAQGTDRFSRGRYFFERSRAAADRLGVALNWKLEEVPGAGHGDEAMLPAAVARLNTASANSD